jgi:hypothetical protein
MDTIFRQKSSDQAVDARELSALRTLEADVLRARHGINSSSASYRRIHASTVATAKHVEKA